MLRAQAPGEDHVGWGLITHRNLPFAIYFLYRNGRVLCADAVISWTALTLLWPEALYSAQNAPNIGWQLGFTQTCWRSLSTTPDLLAITSRRGWNKGREEKGKKWRVLEPAHSRKFSMVDADGCDSHFIAVLYISEPSLPLFHRRS